MVNAQSFAKLRGMLFGGCWQPQANHSQPEPRVVSMGRGSSDFALEPLEPRLLLAADLTGLVTAHTLADPSVPTNVETATVQVKNQGTTAATLST